MFAVVFIPNFCLQSVLRPEPDLCGRAVALVDPELPKPCIVQLTEAARACGVAEGLTASQAMARCGDLLIKPRSHTQERAATDVLLQTAYAFSPCIEATAAGVCTLELKGFGLDSATETQSAMLDTGCSMPDDGQRQPSAHPASSIQHPVSAFANSWAQKVQSALATFQLQAQIGFGPTPELALLAARAPGKTTTLTLTLSRRTGEGTRCDASLGSNVPPATTPAARSNESDASQRPPSPVRRERAGVRVPEQLRVDLKFPPTLESLPLTALEPAPDIFEILRRWGIHTVGELLALGKDRVVERLGPEAAALFDRVDPTALRPLQRVAPSEEFIEQIEFENEIETIEPLLFVLRRFVEQLSRRLELIYLVVADFELRLGLASGAAYERTFKIPSPTGSVPTLFRMLHTHLETVRTDSPITSLRLSARPGKPQAHQFGLFETSLRDPNQFAETLARLTALCGPDRAGTPQPQTTHRPDAFRMTVPVEVRGARCQVSGRPEVPVEVRGARCQVSGKGSDGVSPSLPDTSHLTPRTSGLPGTSSALPLRRFRPALSAHIEFRGHQPALLRSSVFSGAIAGVRGPFLSSGNWWEENRWTREEWDVQTSDGSLFRVFRSPAGCFVEGVYD